jgi:hypothetical protein
MTADVFAVVLLIAGLIVGTLVGLVFLLKQILSPTVLVKMNDSQLAGRHEASGTR